MPHPNETMLRDAYAAFAAQDVPGMVAHWHPELTWKEGNHNSLTGTYKGHDEVLAMLGKLGKLATITDGTVAIDIDRVVADDTAGVVICTVTATRDGQRLSVRAAHYWTIADGKVKSFEDFEDDGRAQDAMLA